jgi:hypothetical protein
MHKRGTDVFKGAPTCAKGRKDADMATGKSVDWPVHWNEVDPVGAKFGAGSWVSPEQLGQPVHQLGNIHRSHLVQVVAVRSLEWREPQWIANALA